MTEADDIIHDGLLTPDPPKPTGWLPLRQPTPPEPPEPPEREPPGDEGRGPGDERPKRKRVRELFIDELTYYRALAQTDSFILSKSISDLMMGGFKQNAKVMIVGETGSGKSYTALGLAEDVAKWNSLAEFGDLDHVGEFFEPRNNIAVIDPKEIQNLLRRANKLHSVYVIDDAAYTWNNRKWMTKQNEIPGGRRSRRARYSMLGSAS